MRVHREAIPITLPLCVHRKDPRPQLALEGALHRGLTSEGRAMHQVLGEEGFELVEEVRGAA